jgi:hypothetical protein
MAIDNNDLLLLLAGMSGGVGTRRLMQGIMAKTMAKGSGKENVAALMGMMSTDQTSVLSSLSALGATPQNVEISGKIDEVDTGVAAATTAVRLVDSKSIAIRDAIGTPASGTLSGQVDELKTGVLGDQDGSIKKTIGAMDGQVGQLHAAVGLLDPERGPLSQQVATIKKAVEEDVLSDTKDGSLKRLITELRKTVEERSTETSVGELKTGVLGDQDGSIKKTIGAMDSQVGQLHAAVGLLDPERGPLSQQVATIKKAVEEDVLSDTKDGSLKKLITALETLVETRSTQASVDALKKAVEEDVLSDGKEGSLKKLVTALRPLIETRSTQASVDKLEPLIETRSTQASVDKLEPLIETRSTQASVDKLKKVVEEDVLSDGKEGSLKKLVTALKPLVETRSTQASVDKLEPLVETRSTQASVDKLAAALLSDDNENSIKKLIKQRSTQASVDQLETRLGAVERSLAQVHGKLDDVLRLVTEIRDGMTPRGPNNDPPGHRDVTPGVSSKRKPREDTSK